MTKITKIRPLSYKEAIADAPRGMKLKEYAETYGFNNLIDEWDKEYNDANNIYIDKITRGGGDPVGWKCEKGHTWITSPAMRTGQNTQCPYCANKKVWRGYNSLEDIHPEVLSLWDYEKNNAEGNYPYNFLPKTPKMVYWKCEKGHSWRSRIAHIVEGHGCPYCTVGHKADPEVDSFKALYPNLVTLFWDYEKNDAIGVYPDKVGPTSRTLAWWKCPCGARYSRSLTNAMKYSLFICKDCQKKQKTSFQEQSIYFYIKQLFPDAINGALHILCSHKELDIYIPSIKYAIEYDGVMHTKINKDIEKNDECKSAGICLIRVRNKKCPIMPDSKNVKIYIHDETNSQLENIIRDIASYLSPDFKMNVDIERDRIKIYEQYIHAIESNSVANLHPALLDYWDYEKNGNIKPTMITIGSLLPLYWKCPVCKNTWIKPAVHMWNKKDNIPQQCTFCHPLKEAVINLDTGEEFDSIINASKKYNIDRHKISSVCHGKMEVAGGYHWKFINENSKKEK